MTMTFRNLERAGAELEQFHRELGQLEKRFNSLRESLGKTITVDLIAKQSCLPTKRSYRVVKKAPEASEPGPAPCESLSLTNSLLWHG
jgi:hypothetical protein